MGYLFFAILLIVIIAIAEQRERMYRRHNTGDNAAGKGGSEFDDRLVSGLSITKGAFIALLVLGTFWSSYNQVPTGNVGVIYSFNRIVGQTEDGLQFTWPWQRVVAATAQVQGYHFTEKELSSFSKESQIVDVAATLNISVSRVHIQTLYKNVGPNYFDVLVAPRVRQAFKDETVKYAAVEIAPHREEIRQAVRQRLVRELSADSIDVRDLLIDDIAFSPGFQASIEAKQVRTQKALEEEAGIAVSRAEAQQLVEKQRGEGEAALAKAEKQAQANRELAASLTPLLVRQNTIEKLAPNARVVVVPSGQNLILGSDTAQ